MNTPRNIPAHIDEANCWMPRRRMLKYQWVKAIGGLLIGGIFAGWLFIEWSSITMRIFASTLMLATMWIIISSILEDIHRSRGRQVTLDGDVLTVTHPQGVACITISDIARGAWNEQTYDRAGLWLYNRAGDVLAHLDRNFLGDQAEARAFLHWARKRSELSFNIDWPTTS